MENLKWNQNIGFIRKKKHKDYKEKMCDQILNIQEGKEKDLFPNKFNFNYYLLISSNEVKKIYLNFTIIFYIN